MVHDTTPQRHLKLVGDTAATEGIDMGVIYEEETPAAGKGAPIQGRLVEATEGQAALTPAKARLADVNAHLRASLEAAHTYAMLAWARWMDATTGYVMDPALRQDELDAAEKALDDRRVRAAKQVTRALEPAKKTAAEREVERLKRRMVSELEVDARVLKARGARLAKRFTIPAAVVAGPIAALTLGAPVLVLLAWPAAWAWLALQGRAHARTELGTVSATALEEKARHLAATPAPSAPAGQAPATVMGATDAENRILTRLAEWDSRADRRGLAGVTVDAPALDASGICVVLHTNSRITPTALAKKVDAVRALLRVPTATKMEITPGEVGDQALLRIRTRAKALDTIWHPGRAGVGLDIDTGEAVVLPKGRKLIAGTSGAGKSVLLRVVMAAALVDDEPTVVVYIDGKGEESSLWVGKVRIAVEPEEIVAVVRELVAESDDRSRIMRERQVATWVPTPDRPRIVAVVDEGAEVMAVDDDEETPILGGLRSIGRTGRSRCVDLVWCTQKPTIGAGIDSQINGVMDVRAVLRTAGDTETRQVLGKGWSAHELPEFGHVLAKGTGRGPDQAPVAVWNLSEDAKVRALPDREPWSYRRQDDDAAPAEEGEGQEREMPEALAVALELSQGRGGVRAEVVAEQMGVDIVDVYQVMQDMGIRASRYTPMAGEGQERGYSRKDLEAAVGYGQ